MSTRRLRSAIASPLGIATTIGVLGVLAVAVVAPMIWGEQASISDPGQISQPPSPEHPFGTDAGGRDVLLRTLVATQLSVAMALCATAIGVCFGIFFGLVPAMLGTRTSRLVVSSINIAVAFPALLLAIGLAVVLGQSALSAVIAIGAAMTPDYARLTYTLSASVLGRDYVAAAHVLGVPRWTIMFRHVLPNIRDPLIVRATISAGASLVAFASLSFLGLGVQAPDYDWGRLLGEGQTRIFVSPASALVPGAAIVIAGLVFTLFGEFLAKNLPGTGSVRTPRGARRPPQPHADHNTDGALPEDTERVLSVRDLVVSAPAEAGWTHPVQSISFDVARGEILGIVGESGSGKSLSMMSIAGLTDLPLRASAGRLEFDGVTLAGPGEISADAVNRRHARLLGTRLAMVFQDPMSSLNPALKVGPQVAEIAQLHEGAKRRTALQRAIDRLRAVHIPRPEQSAQQYPHEFSGGMRQRAMIAMGLMGTPKLIIADEPTTALDVTVQKGVLGLLTEINRTDDTAIVLISHDIAVITAVCTRVLVMYRGRIVEAVSVDDLVGGRARHPYTRALLDSVPTMDGDRSERLATIPEDRVFDIDIDIDADSDSDADADRPVEVVG
ncbi:dipeptide/oligopeptide/nickel ABC transporter permease/ATP-binding protein [Agromyces laixinhei]|uniref:dipeptide/oligopeptide/nickel ABC transporter permease/ATP-binding protein n=1 Tax=Agromyces laixinhei TaxID=2585717 RepID=UPI001116C763|nr:dipeptide/oligopeptide/nickel ABC transporter permease/ATP-binding protein [Agromyces laixinhei]